MADAQQGTGGGPKQAMDGVPVAAPYHQFPNLNQAPTAALIPPAMKTDPVKAPGGIPVAPTASMPEAVKQEMMASKSEPQAMVPPVASHRPPPTAAPVLQPKPYVAPAPLAAAVAPMAPVAKMSTNEVTPPVAQDVSLALPSITALNPMAQPQQPPPPQQHPPQPVATAAQPDKPPVLQDAPMPVSSTPVPPKPAVQAAATSVPVTSSSSTPTHPTPVHAARALQPVTSVAVQSPAVPQPPVASQPAALLHQAPVVAAPAAPATSAVPPPSLPASTAMPAVPPSLPNSVLPSTQQPLRAVAETSAHVPPAGDATARPAMATNVAMAVGPPVVEKSPLPGAASSVPAPYGLTQQHLQQHVADSAPLQSAAVPVAPAPQRTRELGQHDADTYIDQVKQHFQYHPHKYTKFLEIMKELPRNRDSMDPTNNVNNVIQRVHELFMGQDPALIDGFNRFLPQGSLENSDVASAGPRAYPKAPTAPPGGGGTPLLPGGDASKTTALSSSSRLPGAAEDPMAVARHGAVHMPVPAHPPTIPDASIPTTIQHHQPATTPSMHTPSTMTAVPAPHTVHTPAAQAEPEGGVVGASDGDATKNPGELRHALGFITKIKERFENDMDTYKEFLQILHHYRLKKLTIKDVYENVMKLFNGHADLLEEFRHFLPDPKPPAHEAERYQQHIQKARAAEAANSRMAAGLSMGQDQLMEDVGSSRKKKEPAKPITMTVEGTSGNDLFSRTKKRLKAGPAWVSLMKLVHLFNIDILSRVELIVLLEDLLCRHQDLIQDFRTTLAIEEPEWDEDDDGGDDDVDAGRLAQQDDEKSVYMTSINNMDFSECERLGPSYRSLPAGYVAPTCRGRADCHAAQTLNDVWVSVSQGNETDTSFKTTRKNQYEDMLFRIEDDRFEMDMSIYAASSCVQYLEKQKKEIDAMTADQRSSHRLRNIPALHRRTICKVYGTEKCDEVLHMLEENTAASVKVLLERFKSVDTVLRNMRRDRQDPWRALAVANHTKALDHRSFYFKQADRRFVSVKGVLSEMKELVENAQSNGGDACLVTEMPDAQIHIDIARLVLPHAHKFLNATDTARLQAFWKRYITVFFNTPPPPTTSDLSDSEDEGKDADGDANMDASKATAADAQQDGGKENDKVNGEADSAAPRRRIAEDHQRMLYGSNVFFVFFRLYAIMYSRLQHARNLAQARGENKEKDSKDRSKEMAHIPALPEDSGYISELVLNQVGDTEGEDGTEKEKAGEKDLYQRYLSAVERCVNGMNEGQSNGTAWYEDECRDLLGSEAYRLFTMERIIQQLLKQFPILRSHETYAVMIGHFDAYISEQTTSVEDYRNLCTEYVRDDNCYAMEYCPKNKKLSMRWLDPCGEDNYGHTTAAEDYAGWLSSNNGLKREYDQLNQIFLVRNVRKMAGRKDLTQFYTHNGMSNKIWHRNFKLAYVQNTTDVFIRRKRRKHTAQPSTVVTGAMVDEKSDSTKVEKVLETDITMVDAAPVREQSVVADSAGNGAVGDQAVDAAGAKVAVLNGHSGAV